MFKTQNKNHGLGKTVYIYIYRVALVLILISGLVLLQTHRESYASESIFSIPSANPSMGDGLSYSNRQELDKIKSDLIEETSNIGIGMTHEYIAYFSEGRTWGDNVDPDTVIRSNIVCPLGKSPNLIYKCLKSTTFGGCSSYSNTLGNPPCK